MSVAASPVFARLDTLNALKGMQRCFEAAGSSIFHRRRGLSNPFLKAMPRPLGTDRVVFKLDGFCLLSPFLRLGRRGAL